jgi:hypothetical protein
MKLPRKVTVGLIPPSLQEHQLLPAGFAPSALP